MVFVDNVLKMLGIKNFYVMKKYFGHGYCCFQNSGSDRASYQMLSYCRYSLIGVFKECGLEWGLRNGISHGYCCFQNSGSNRASYQMLSYCG